MPPVSRSLPAVCLAAVLTACAPATLLAADFLNVSNPVVVTDEDVAVPLGLSVAADLFDGGALQDVIATDTLFRPDSAGTTPVVSTIPAGASGIAVVGYSTQSRNTGGNDATDDDYQLLNARVDLVAGTSSGRVAHLVDGKLNRLDQYAWSAVPLGQAVLSDASKVTGHSTGAIDPVISVVAGELRIVETHALETAYHVEYLTADGDSTNFLGAANTVQDAGTASSTLALAPRLEPASGKRGFIALNGTSAAAGSNSAVEHKGFSRLMIDLEAGTVSGAIAAQRGESADNTVTYAFWGYPLVDLRDGPATPVDVIAGSTRVVGDTAAGATVLQNPTLYIDASGRLVIERAASFAGVFTTMYTAELYERTGFSSIASFVATASADALFDASPVDGVDPDGAPIDEFRFAVPASARVGILNASWNTIGGSDTNENVGLGFALVDLEAGTSAGSITFIRASTPDLVSWDAVPLGQTMFGATSGGVPLFQSNKAANRFTDGFPRTARFTLESAADGSRTLVFSATSEGGGQNFRDYRGNATVSWLGNEPFSISGVPVAGLFSKGSPVGTDGWELDFEDIPGLAYEPAPHESGVVPLSFTLSSTGETETLEVRIAPVADAPALVADDVVGYAGNPIPLDVTVADSADTDGSESQLGVLRLDGVPGDVTLSADAGSVVDVGGGVWDVSREALPTLVATGSSEIVAAVRVRGTNVDARDVDADGAIEDGDNGSGIDERDTFDVVDTFELAIRAVPTVVALTVSNGTPTIRGTTGTGAGEALSVTVNGVTYTSANPALVVDAGGGWTLAIPAANALPENAYAVTASLAHVSGTSGADTTSDELIVDLTPPPAPGVTSQTTTDTTPVIEGTVAIADGTTLTITVGGFTYTEGDGRLVNRGDGTWSLAIPADRALPDATHQVVATLTDAAGNEARDAGLDELVVDTTAPPTPGVTSQTVADRTPVIEGTATVGAGETLTVEVDGRTYTAGDGALVDNGDGTWTLAIPSTAPIAEGWHDVTAAVTDAAGNRSVDPSMGELTVDVTAPMEPTVEAQLTNDPTPTLSGTATVAAGETLTVELDGRTYTAGDGALTDHGDGTWALAIPVDAALTDGTYAVTARITDAAGNATADRTSDELRIDRSLPSTPVVTIVEDVNDDGALNIAELMGDVDVRVTLGDDVRVGDTLSLTIGTVTSERTLLASEVVAGRIELSVPAPADGEALEVAARVIDAAGNASPVARDAAAPDLTAPPVPTVDALLTASTTPTLVGIAATRPGDTLSVTVNGVRYVAGDGALSDRGDGTWTLAIPAADALPEGTHDVAVTLTDPAGNVAADTSADELVVDPVAPDDPSVVSLVTNAARPVLTGRFSTEAGLVRTVEVDGTVYTDGDGALTIDVDGGWTLVLPDGLTENEYLVRAVATDAAGNRASGTGRLTIDRTPPPAPGVTSQVTRDATPVVEGTWPLDPTLALAVTLDGRRYTGDDGHLVAADDGTWTLSVPDEAALVDALHDVVAEVRDPAGNVAVDPGTGELLVDTDAPAAPGVTSLTTNDPTPPVEGTVALGPGEVLTVTIAGRSFSAGAGELGTADTVLVVTPGGTWTLLYPVPLAEGAYDVFASVVDRAGNRVDDPSAGELLIDLTAPVVPSFEGRLSASAVPVLSGRATVGTGETLMVDVGGRTYVAGDGSLVVDADGAWTLAVDPRDALADGEHEVVVRVRDAAGNVSRNAPDERVTVDTRSPALTVDAGAEHTVFRPTIGGTSDAPDGATVVVRNALGETLCTALVTGGRWSCAPLDDLAEGDNRLVAETVDAAGNRRAVDVVVAVSRDFDGDGIPNLREGFDDSDGDGVLDRDDLDADNDGVPDAEEGSRDTDGDLVPDYLDLDADNDGIADLLEAGGPDADGDFTVDGFRDANGDGLDDALQRAPLPLPDTDADGIPDRLDVDSDQDGIPDLVETLGTDLDDDGRIDDFSDTDVDGVDDGARAFPLVFLDSDGDGVPDHLDRDADGDGLLDVVEAGGVDADGDGVVDALADADRDGVPDSVDADVTGGADADGDGIDDRYDVDFVLGDDSDRDGIVDAADPDADGDGRADPSPGAPSLGGALPDADGDGTPDVRQSGEAILHVGLRGRGGCTIGGAGADDPSLLVLLAAALLALGKGRRRTDRAERRASLTRRGTACVSAGRDPFGFHPLATHRAARVAPVAFLLAVCAVLSTQVHAQAAAIEAEAEAEAGIDAGVRVDRFRRHPYMAVGAGFSVLAPDASRIAVEVEDGRDAAFRAALGIDLTERFSLELSATDLGRAELSGGRHVDYRLASIDALLYGLGDRDGRARRRGTNLYARVGLSRMRNHADIPYARDNDTSLSFGGGLEYGFDNGLAVRAELISFDEDAHHGGVSLLYRIGYRDGAANGVGTPSTVGHDPASSSRGVAVVDPAPAVTLSRDTAPAGTAPVLTASGDTVPRGRASVDPVSLAAASDAGATLGPLAARPVMFRSDSVLLDRDGMIAIVNVAARLRAAPDHRVVLEGYSDRSGSAAYNQRLAERRVDRVRDLLLMRGVDATRVGSSAIGATSRFATDDTPEGRRENRRVEMRIER